MVFCEIKFENNPDAVYHPGQIVRGTVRVVLPERKEVRGVYIKFKGDAYAAWKDELNREISEKLLRFIQYFAKGNNGNLYLEAGEYVSNFELQLAQDLPSSFDGTYGHIKYHAIVVLIIPWGLDIKFKQPITINRALDLNQYPFVRKPFYDETYFASDPCGSYCCFPSEPLHIAASIPFRGYIPGQEIILLLQVDNKSNQRIPHFKMQLVKVVTYIAGTASTTQKNYQAFTLSSRGVEVNQKRILRMNLQVSADLDTICSDPKLKIPITIGTVPIHDFAVLNQVDQAATFGLSSADTQPSTHSRI